MRSPRVKILALSIIGSIVILCGTLLILQDTSETETKGYLPQSPFTFDPDKARAYWSRRIETVGGAAAWSELAAGYASADFGVQHTAAHVFGEALYEETGIDGISVCDAAFAYGCYHSFFGGAFAEHGVGMATRLLALCRHRFGGATVGCEHGIGHGLIEFLGGDRLREALAACPEDRHPYYGCAAGVFMEYNSPVVIQGSVSASVPRPYDPRQPYAPCPDLPARFKEACYHELPGWWLTNQGADKASMQDLCNQVPEPIFRKACTAGLPAHL